MRKPKNQIGYVAVWCSILASINVEPSALSADSVPQANSSLVNKSIESNVDLRPAQPTPAQDNSASSRTENAVTAVKENLIQHKSASKNPTNNAPPSTESGASGDKAPPLLMNGTQTESGPSASSANSGKLEEIQLNRPVLNSLVSVNEYLNPFQLDASNSSTITLRTALTQGIDQNLDLAISRTNTKQKQWAFFASLGNFLPSPVLGFSDYFTDGRIGLPNGVSSFFRSAAGAAATTGTASSTMASGSSGGTTISLHKPFEIMDAGFEYYAYRGGSVLFGALENRNTYRAAKLLENASLSDTLLSITQNYYNVVLAETLLQIRIDAVRTSNEQLKRNEDRFHAGLATNLDVLQSKTQLSRDRQALMDQQVSRRSASISLADSLNANLGEDLLPVENTVKKVRLIDPRMTVSDLLRLAIDHRPELKEYEELRRAAKKAIIVAAAPLQPTVKLSGGAYGIGPPSNVQALGLFTVNVNWTPRGFGTVDFSNIQQARWQARQANLQAQKELQTVLNDVRNSYIQILDKERNIEEASDEVRSSLEELRLAELRTGNGLGINLDIITAQRDYTQALVDKAQAIINFNISQAKLIHDLGLTSVDSLTSGRLLSKASIR